MTQQGTADSSRNICCKKARCGGGIFPGLKQQCLMIVMLRQKTSEPLPFCQLNALKNHVCAPEVI